MMNWSLRAAILMTLVFVPLGCGKKSVVGIWKGHHPGHGAFLEGYFDVMLYFNANGTMGGTIDREGYSGTWSVNGDQLTVNAKSKDGVLNGTETFSISGNILTLDNFPLTNDKIDLFKDDE